MTQAPGAGATEVELVVDRQVGERVDVALAAMPEVGSRAAAQRLIDAGRVSVDGLIRPKRHQLSAGERVHVTLDAPSPDASAAAAGAGVPYTVAFEDEHLIVVDKPAGVVVHPAPAHPSGTLAQALAGRAAGGPDAWRPGIVHRLDRDTSGLLVVAKSEAVHRALQRAIRDRALARGYAALVAGRPASSSGTVEAPIGRDRRDRTLVSMSTDRPRPARTHFTVVEPFGRTTLLDVRLDTGRTHQIRVHMAAIGHPVCGDARYGGGPSGWEVRLSRQFLHAARLRFEHPVSGEPVDLSSGLPADLTAALEVARAA